MFRVQRKNCDQCLFTDRKIVSDACKTKILKDCVKKNSFFVCHKEALAEEELPHDLGLCCRGFYDKFNTRPVGMAKALQIVQFVDVK